MEEVKEIPEEEKYHKQISAQTKMRNLLLYWQKQKTVEQISQELGITKEAFYQWLRKSKKELLKALTPEKAGRHPKNHVEETELREELEKTREALEKTEKEKHLVEQEKKRIVSELWMSRRVLRFWVKKKQIDIKKNAILQHLIKKIFSNVPKKPVGEEISVDTVERQV